MNWKKMLVIGLLMSFGLAIYQVWVQEPYFNALKEQGKPVGIAETALGFFGAWGIMTLLSYWITNRMNGEINSS